MSHRFAIVGCGHVAARHARCIARVGTLAGVCDPDPHKGEAFAAEHRCIAYAGIPQLLAATKPEVAVICSPNGLHADHTAACLAQGVHVLCEKPLCLEVDDGERLVAAARASGLKLFVVHQNRFNRAVQTVARLVAERALGNIRSFQISGVWSRPYPYYESHWRGTLAMDGGTLFTQFSHFIDLAFWWLGELKDVHGWRANFQHRGCIEFEDAGTAVLQMKSGALGTLHYTINAPTQNLEGSFALFGDKGSVKVGGKYLDKLEFAHGSAGNAGADGPPDDSLFLLYTEIVKALDGAREYELVSGEDALQSVKMIRQIYDSSPMIDPPL